MATSVTDPHTLDTTMMTTQLCPICQKLAETAGNPHLPFCSERCKLLDLGRWAAGDYRIAGESVNLVEVNEEVTEEN